MYRHYMQEELRLLEGILQEGIKARLFKPCDTAKIASGILTLSEAIKFREFHTTNALSAMDVDYSKITEEILYLTGLILDGLQCEKNE